MRNRQAELPALVVMALVLAIIVIPVAIAVKDTPPHWRGTAADVWGRK